MSQFVLNNKYNTFYTNLVNAWLWRTFSANLVKQLCVVVVSISWLLLNSISVLVVLTS